MNKVKDRVVGHGAFITDSRTQITAMPNGGAWKDCKCGRTTLSNDGVCWKCREKES